MSREQKEVYDKAYPTCQNMLGDKFLWKDENDALIGPLSSLLYVPSIANLYLEFAAELGKLPGLSREAREVAILATGSVFDCRYELYSHARLAASTSLSKVQIESARTGQKPLGEHAWDEQCDVAFDVAIELTRNHGPMVDDHWRKAQKVFGMEGAAALIQYVALYAYTCVLLNAVDEPVP